MDARALREFLLLLKEQAATQGHFLGFLHILIGRNITLRDGTPVTSGMSWRDVCAWLKKLRWDKECVRELGLDPETLPPRDRERYWYTAISKAKVDSVEAATAADQLAEKLKTLGYTIGPAPGLKP
jgi:hypothetical protein